MKRLSSLFVLLLCLTMTSGLVVAQKKQRREFSGKTMGPIDYQVIVYAENGGPIEKMEEGIKSELERVNQLMSTYIEDSDVSRFNRYDKGDWFSVDSETAKVVSRALEISRLSEGAFDITVAPAVKLWNFGPDRKRFKVPADETVNQVCSQVGYEQLICRLDPPALKKSNPELSIDLSAIAKGYAVDAVANYLRNLEMTDFMVVVGGEVYSVGTKSGQSPWYTGIEKPSDRTIEIETRISLDGQAVATSGDYRNFSIRDGVRYSHTIDPRTCRPVTNQMATAAVVADDCMTADAVATAVMVMGAKKGLVFCKANGMELFAIERDAADPTDDSRFTRTSSSGFPFVDEKNGQPEKKKRMPSGSILRVFLAAALLFGLAIAGMAIGAIFGNKPIQGSCGGLANMKNADGDMACGVCEQPATDCVDNKA